MKVTDAQPSGRDDNDINLTPMLDVVFIMLIFFIVTASFIREQGLPVDSPDRDARPDSTAAAILVSIDDQSAIWIEQRLIDPRAVRANLLRLRTGNPDRPVVIQPDPRSRTEALVQVLDSARSAGIYDAALAPLSGR